MSGQSIRQLMQALRTGNTTVLEIYEECLDRLQRLQHLNAIVTATTEQAKIQAQQAHDRLKQGKPK